MPIMPPVSINNSDVASPPHGGSNTTHDLVVTSHCSSPSSISLISSVSFATHNAPPTLPVANNDSWPSLLGPLLWLSLPLAVVNLLTFCISIVPLIFVGHIDSALIGPVGLANSLMKVVGTAAIEGASTAFDSIGAQLIGQCRVNMLEDNHDGQQSPAASHDGIIVTVISESATPPSTTNQVQQPLLRPNTSFHSVGRLLQSCFLFELIMCIPIAIVWVNAHSIFVKLGQTEDVASKAQQYMYPMLLGLVPSVISRLLQGWLNVQNITRELTFCTLLNLVTQLLLHFLFITIGKVGFMGAAWATAINQMLLCLSLSSVIFVRGLHTLTWPTTLWPGWRVLVKPAVPVLRLAVPGVIMVSLEWSVFEACTLIAGSRSTDALGAIVVLINVISTVFMLPTGISIAVGVLVGQALGEGKPAIAKRFALLALLTGLLVNLIPESIIFFAGSSVVSLFTSNAAITSLLHSLYPWVAAQLAVDCVQGILGGVLRGVAKQRYAAYSNFFGYYIVGIPLGILLVFALLNNTDYHVSFGLLMGLLAGAGSTAISYGIGVARIDWSMESMAAQKRMTEKEEDQ